MTVLGIILHGIDWYEILTHKNYDTSILYPWRTLAESVSIVAMGIGILI